MKVPAIPDFESFVESLANVSKRVWSIWMDKICNHLLVTS